MLHSSGYKPVGCEVKYLQDAAFFFLNYTSENHTFIAKVNSCFKACGKVGAVVMEMEGG